ncbi:hypothetical protein ABTM72_19370, partial [Acinetobacter baumannii]
GVRKLRVQPVKRDWVLKGLSVPTGPIKVTGVSPFALMNAELVTKIRKAGIAIEDQGDRGTCTIFATKFLTEYEWARQHKFASSVRLNPEYL